MKNKLRYLLCFMGAYYTTHAYASEHTPMKLIYTPSSFAKKLEAWNEELSRSSEAREKRVHIDKYDAKKLTDAVVARTQYKRGYSVKLKELVTDSSHRSTVLFAIHSLTEDFYKFPNPPDKMTLDYRTFMLLVQYGARSIEHPTTNEEIIIDTGMGSDSKIVANETFTALLKEYRTCENH